MTSDDYARAIIAEGQRRAITPKGIQIALATALVESELRMLANEADPPSMNFPHEGVGSDHQSVGLFQQQPWWGTIACRMDAACSAGQFYNGVGTNKGLTAFDYTSDAHSPGSYAQAVQVSANPNAYDNRWNDAVALYDRLATPANANDWPLPDPPRIYWGPQQGPDNAWSNLDESEPSYSHDGLTRWQTALGIPATGVFDGTTKAAAILCQQSHDWAVTGNVYKGEWDAVINQSWRLPTGVPLPTTGILRANIDYAIQIFTLRVGDPYVEGGPTLDPNNVSAGTDCSGLVSEELEALVYGSTNMDWSRRCTTENWPYDYANQVAVAPGTAGPYGTICAGRSPGGLAAIPAGAIAIIPIMHRGGGDSSHMEIQVEGVLMESGGRHNNVPPGASGSIGGAAQGATALNNPEWTDYWYLPGPIIENTLPASVTAPPDYLQLIYEQLAGPDGHGWQQLGTNADGTNLTIVQFLAKYKPALDELLAQNGEVKTTTTLPTTTPPATSTAASHVALDAEILPAAKAASLNRKAADKAVSPAKKRAPRNTPGRKA
ncbi:hypothetical protein FZI85_05760 [Mycobacterium sp. CBMA293]|uniref:hypothetical protein n=1 Tax=unclassified Mycolicibacterium TaxID=2636767 RepID=UPI0012DFA553|nr:MULTISPECIES: hypothetical protein [unclassified Mycolicibacterium]MUL48787.1 hypothetical protein [Mycolicibacterium sp. CBMA 360]MUL62242.1 hypothetical protein [Mycolicibacterium sp. CBMA 335]MUL71702.1 hypothetical protein [Mycolicibacterium sp. CBMA 311]MUL93657.1 hypothetical protein [Mycolicibacterium sp. CBMA 230]MUM09340.1 hypothetical protein [Mycolicibacterium sp. CBMA 213]